MPSRCGRASPSRLVRGAGKKRPERPEGPRSVSDTFDAHGDPVEQLLPKDRHAPAGWRRHLRSGALLVALAWPLLAFGGAYWWAGPPYVGGAIALAWVARSTEGRRVVDGAGRLLALVAASVALQLIPLPRHLLALVSPGATPLVGRLAPYATAAPDSNSEWGSISIAPLATLWGLSILTGSLLLFCAARSLCDTGGTRSALRGLAWLGLLVAFLAIVQRATAPELIYWWWRPENEGAAPFGTFVNRNHFATWLVMAIPACFGYALARLRPRRPHGPPGTVATALRALDGRTGGLLAAACVMTLALVISLSRSGLAGLLAAMLCLWWLTRRAHDPSRRVLLTGYLALSLAAVLSWASIPAILDRLTQTLVASASRLLIWRDTLALVADFWPAGVGIGAYADAMLAYQTSNPEVYFNHAHNHYLHLVAEGGLLVVVPSVVAVLAGLRLARKRCAEASGGMLWIRAGAMAGLAGVGVQSLWDTGLRMPANAALAALLAAVATHASRPSHPERDDER